MLLRDLVNGKKRFADFLASPERIATNVLTARLAQMEADGLVTSRLYQARPKRYEYALTPKGAALLPVLQSICVWAGEHLPDRWTPPDAFMRKRPSDLV